MSKNFIKRKPYIKGRAPRFRSEAPYLLTLKQYFCSTFKCPR